MRIQPPTSLAIILLAFAALTLGACVVETRHHLAAPGSEPVDQRLVGAWRLVDDRTGNLGVIVIRESDDGMLDMLQFEAGDDETSGDQSHTWSQAQAWTTVLGGEAYANLVIEGETLIVAYRLLDDGTMIVGLMHVDLFRSAITEGRLQGTVTAGSLGNTVTVTADGEALSTFLERNGGHGLFDFGGADAQIMFRPYRFETR